MIIVVLFAAILFYGVMYLLYVNANGRLTSASSWLQAINDMVLMPEQDIFRILRLAILIVIIYIVVDLIITSAKKARRRKQENEPQVITFKDPSVR